MSGTTSIFNLSKNNQKNRDKKATEPTIKCHQCKINVRNTVAKVRLFVKSRYSSLIFYMLQMSNSKLLACFKFEHKIHEQHTF